MTARAPKEMPVLDMSFEEAVERFSGVLVPELKVNFAREKRKKLYRTKTKKRSKQSKRK